MNQQRRIAAHTASVGHAATIQSQPVAIKQLQAEVQRVLAENARRRIRDHQHKQLTRDRWSGGGDGDSDGDG